jgi:predicted phosphodiesterase
LLASFKQLGSPKQIDRMSKKRAIISDIHANLEALEAVLADIEHQGIERVFCLGDIVGYGPNPRECVDKCFQFESCILGNHDLGALYDPEGFSSGAEQAIFWTRAQLEDKSIAGNVERWQFLSELPRTIRENDVMFVHGSPRAPLTEYVFPEDVFNSKKLERIFALVDHYCFQGHTHVPGIFMHNCYDLGKEKIMVNVGSVGQPRDGDPRACYVVLEENSLQFRRVEYPYQTTRQKIHDTPGLDNLLGDRLCQGR